MQGFREGLFSFFLWIVFETNALEKNYICNPQGNFLQGIHYNSLRKPKFEFPNNEGFDGSSYECPPLDLSLYVGEDGLRTYIREMIAMGTSEDINSGKTVLNYAKDCVPPNLAYYDYTNNINQVIETVSSTTPTENDKNKFYKQQKYADFVVGIDMNANGPGKGIDYMVKTKSTTSWMKFKLDRNSIIQLECKGKRPEEQHNCDNTLFELPSQIFDSPLEVQNRFMKLENYGYANTNNDFVFRLPSKTTTGGLSQVTLPQGGKAWGIEMKGCTLPALKIRVEYEQSTQQKQGSALLEDEFPDYIHARRRLLEFKNATRSQRRLQQQAVMPCWRRVIKIIDIISSDQVPSNYHNKTLKDHQLQCMMPIDIDRVKFWKDNNQNVHDKLRDNIFAQDYYDSSVLIFYSNTFIKQIERCASDTKGWYWKGFEAQSSKLTSSYPGICAACPSLTGSQARSKMISTYCDPSKPQEAGRDCCFRCRSGFESFTDASSPYPTCMRSCLEGYYMLRAAATCVRCEVGKHSPGGNASECRSCAELGFFNSRYVAGRGCVSCGAFARVSPSDPKKCDACPLNQYVTGRNPDCLPCPQGKYFAQSIQNCEACPAGTRGKSDGTCELCPMNSYSNKNGSTFCDLCQNGKYSANGNRSSCTACSPLKSSYSEYYQPGCSFVRCKPNIAYEAGNPYQADGCKPCDSDSRLVPKGSYRSSTDCSQYLPCTNKAASNAEYTGPATIGTTLCPWVCNPAFRKNIAGTACDPCPVPFAFDSIKHEYIDENCNWDCKPGIQRTSLAKVCSESCVDLLAEKAKQHIMDRVRFYHPNKHRPAYVHGQCGMNDVLIPHDELLFLRKGRWAAVLTLAPTSNERCGNQLLDTNEECDDGNQNNNDGCSDACKLEYSQPNKFWDCDEIGKSCNSDCGWPRDEAQIESWGLNLRGFVFPKCSGQNCSCNASISKLWKGGNAFYYDVVRLPVGTRQAWMQANLISCDCNGNPMRMLSDLTQCTPENRGCRECAASEYFHDVRRECVKCGAHCLTGFRDSGQGCQGLVTTDQPLKTQQSQIGCTPCDQRGLSVFNNVVWLPNNATHSCRFRCYRDSTGTNTTQDTYCMTALDVLTDSCTSSCRSCAQMRETMVAPEAGYYLQGCLDEDGYKPMPCDPSIIPENAQWKKMVRPVFGDKDNCEWECKQNFHHLEKERACALIFTWTIGMPFPCTPGKYLEPYDNSNRYVCKKCEEVETFAPYQVWRAQKPYYRNCIAQCEQGVAWSSGGANVNDFQQNVSWTCNLCTQVECNLGEEKKACTEDRDAYCEPCQAPAMQNAEFEEPGTCNTRCASGFYLNFVQGQKTCSSCQSVTSSSACGLGRRWSSRLCAVPEERRSVPVCEPCPFTSAYLNETNQQYKPTILFQTDSSDCQLQCKRGYVSRQQQQSCVACGESLCGYGYHTRCSDVSERDKDYGTLVWKTSLFCTPCYELYPVNLVDPQLPNYYPDLVYLRNGSCDVRCALPSHDFQNGRCVPRTDGGAGSLQPPVQSEEERQAFERDLNLALYLYHHGYPERQNI